MADFRLVTIMLMAIVVSLGTSKPVFQMSDDNVDYFTTADTNNDGFVDRPELLVFMESTSANENQSLDVLANSLFTTSDANGDDKLSKEEFNSIYDF